MPLGFQTMSHGEIAIGFFNIESDMFLMDDHFIFASDLCGAISEWSRGPADLETDLEMYVIEDHSDIGNLMGAINGVIFTGFIGELYKMFPFPERPEDFKQNPEGYRTRNEVKGLIEKYAEPGKVKVRISDVEGTITIGPFAFDPHQFHQVLQYIWRGGMPRWKGGKGPEYVEDMRKTVMGSSHWLFRTE